MARILFERTGGFMGRKVSLNIDFADLSDDQVALLEDLLASADFFELSPDLTQNLMPDEFSYNITVISGERQHSVLVTDSTVPDSLRPLLDELGNQARMQR